MEFNIKPLHRTHMHTQKKPLQFVSLKLGISLRYAWLFIPLQGMQTHMGLHDSISVNKMTGQFFDGFDCSKVP